MIHCIQADSGKFRQHGHRERTLAQAHKYSSVDSQSHSYQQGKLDAHNSNVTNIFDFSRELAYVTVLLVLTCVTGSAYESIITLTHSNCCIACSINTKRITF